MMAEVNLKISWKINENILNSKNKYVRKKLEIFFNSELSLLFICLDNILNDAKQFLFIYLPIY